MFSVASSASGVGGSGGIIIGSGGMRAPTIPLQIETKRPQEEILGENLQQIINLPFAEPFTKYLNYKQTDADVKRLQILLNSDPDTKLTDSGVGSSDKETNYFGPLTKSAVIKFQEKYAADILSPWNLIRGTGFIGKTTLAKINELISKIIGR